ncbi:hypothetical protein FACS1894208_07220 [Clostridia bacterium]|nr:hypothetical protein FACS1894208_07220 [Clostridia bacterium]
MERDYLSRIAADLITQFKDQPRTSVLVEAVAEQLQDVHSFFVQLNELRALNTAVGRQLDGIGDIVVMSRAEAARLAGFDNAEAFPDETYRKYLKYKIFLNTSNGTYHDVLNGLKMFVEGIPLYYTEEPEHPATMFFDTPDLSDDDVEYIFSAPIARAAGVQVVIRARTKTPLFCNITVTPVTQYKWTSTKQSGWIRPGDERNIIVTLLTQFKHTRTEPQFYGLLPMERDITVTTLAQFKFSRYAPPERIAFTPGIRLNVFVQFRSSRKSIPQYTE